MNGKSQDRGGVPYSGANPLEVNSDIIIAANTLITEALTLKAGGVQGIDFGITDGGESEITVYHNLGQIPSFVALLPQNWGVLTINRSVLVINNIVLQAITSNSVEAQKSSTDISSTSITFYSYLSTCFRRGTYYWFAIA